MRSVEYPASDPYVTGVGGTFLTITPDGAYNGETVWNEALGDEYGYGSTDYTYGTGSTGGFSYDFLAPSWQQLTVDNYVYQDQGTNYNSDDSRGVPDVALNAAEDTATCIDSTLPNGGRGAYGGTSVGAPCWAGMVALVDQALAAQDQPPLGYFNPLLYQVGQSSSYSSLFHQVLVRG